MKKTKKLEIKKVTLQNLDEPTLDAVAGGLMTSKVLCTVGCTGNTCRCEGQPPQG
jgi:hypothetical protein